MANEKRLIPLQKRIVYAGDVFNSLMAEKKWSATEAADFLKDFRTVDAVEVVHGRWEEPYPLYLVCSECGTAYVKYEKYNYCPNCGARMDAEVPDEDV